MSGKKEATKGKMSKGERNNVSRKLCNALRRERDEKDPIGKALRNLEFRQRVINNPKGEMERSLRDRYIKEENFYYEALKLFDMYKAYGLKWAGAMQAVKTNYTDQLHNKYQPLVAAAKQK